MAALARLPGARAQPLRWWSSPELQGIGEALGQRLDGWLADWSVAASRRRANFACVHCADCDAAAGAQWRALGTGAGAAWVEGDSEAAQRLAAWLFGAEPEDGQGDIAAAVARRALDGAARALGSGLGLPPGPAIPPGTALFQPWSGAVVAWLEGPGSPALRLLLDGDCAAALVARPASERRASVQLVALESALAGRRLRARVNLATCEVDLGTLASLRPGDVLSLPHPLDAPACVVWEGAMLCGAYLGSQGGAKAVELTRDAPADGAGARP